MAYNRTKYRINTFLMIIFAVAVCSCSGNGTYKTLERIDSIRQNRIYTPEASGDDSIADILSGMKSKRWYNERNEAYFNLIYADMATERENDEPHYLDSILDVSAKYYKQTDGNKICLARTFIYKARLHKLMLEDRKTAMGYLKKAEEILKKVRDNRTEHDIYDLMFQTYYDIGDVKTAKSYALKTYKASCNLGSDKLKAYSLLNLASVCQDLGEKKECHDYALRMEPLLHACGKSGLPYILNTIGTVVFNTTNDYDKAMTYFNKSLAIRPIPVTYGILAQLEMETGNADKAEEMWQKAIDIEDNDKNVRMPDGNLFALNGMYRFKKGLGQYDEACRYAERIFHVKDSLNTAHQGEAVNEVSAKYDKEVEKNNLNRKIMYYGIVIVLLLAFVAALLVYIRFRSNRTKFRLMEKRLLAAVLRKKIAELEAEGSCNTKEISILRKKINTLQGNMLAILHNGRKLYGDIQNGGTASTWNRADFSDFIEYYKMIDLPFVLHLQNDYEHLSSRKQFFEILYNMGFTDDDVRRILGIGQSTIRTTRSRIKQCEKTDSKIIH